MKELELNKIHNENCLETMKGIPSDSVDCVVTSPPYNKTGFRGKRDSSKGVGRWSGADISYGEFGDDKDEEEYKQEQIEVLNELYRILKPNGSIFYNHKVRRNNGKASHPFEWIVKSKCNFYQQIIWDRGSAVDHNIGYLTPTTELIFWLTKETPKVLKKQDRFSNEIWRINALPMKDHPAPFPEELVGQCLILTTDENDLIYDPYMGSGTSAKVAKQLKRNYIGSEISPEYCQIAEDRIKAISNPLF